MAHTEADFSFTNQEIEDRLAKLNEERANVVQSANAKLAPLEGQALQVAEQKAVIVGNANMAIGRIDGQIAILNELRSPGRKPHLAAVPAAAEGEN